MDRASRFQSHIPLGFNKPVQSEAKVLPPLLLDRFRALVKEREDELRVFGGGRRTGLPQSTDEIVRIYVVFLSELAINSKPIITDLTVIAGEQRAHAKGIAEVICSRIIEVSVDQKLPSLYLLDSIVKNIGKDYIKYFSARLPEVFCEAYLQVHPNMRPAMRHLFGTWSTVFPSSVLRKIEAELQFSPSSNGQSTGLNSSRSSSPMQTHGIHINPKYLGAQHKFGLSPADSVKAEDVKRPVHSAARITKSTPYGTGNARTSPSGSGIDLGHSMLMGTEEGMPEWQSRNWQSTSKQHLNTSVANKYDNNVDLQGPRALISAYGIDEREKHLHYKHQNPEHVDSIGAEERVGTRTWQNTEEEEFDWKDLGPALVGQRHSNINERFSSTLPPLGKSSLRHSTNPISSSTDHGLFNKNAGVLPNTSGFNDSTSLIPSIFARESLISHNLPITVSGTSLLQTSGHNYLRGSVPLNLHGVRPPNFPLHSAEPTSLHAMVAPMSQGYLAPGRGPQAWQAIPGASVPGLSHSLPIGQSIGQVGPIPPGGALSGLLGSLMSQGLISMTKQDSIGVEFDQELLKVRHEPTITSLYSDLPRQCTSCGLRFKSQEDHSKHMDWHVNKNRALKNRKTKPSPKWFVNVSMWLSGAEASGTESVPGFLQPAEDIVEKDDEELAVPADEEQSTCALCGEPFDDFYSDEMEEWMYKGAVYMYAPAGSTLGMDRSQLGPIVHAKCRSDSHGNLPEETRKDEWELPEESHQRKRLRS